MAVLRDGSEVEIRELTPQDGPVLAEAFERLSPESRDLRFLGAKPSLSMRDIKYLTDVDGHFHEALGAVEVASGRGVGVARFVRLAPDASVAEVAVTVVDAWQRRGLGTLLLEELTDRAREEGIDRYTALVSGENKAIVAMLDNIGARVLDEDASAGTVEYEVEISETGLGHSLRSALREAASGRMTLPRRAAEAMRALLARYAPLADAHSDGTVPAASDDAGEARARRRD